jgi:hypothetical protein
VFQKLKGLTENVSYVKAMDLSNAPVQYSLDSPFLSVNKYDGRVFLTAYLKPSNMSMQTDWYVRINATNGNQTASTLNRISVINNSNKPPEFVTFATIFEIEEVS